MKAYFYPYGCYTSDCCQTYFQTELAHLKRYLIKQHKCRFLKMLGGMDTKCLFKTQTVFEVGKDVRPTYYKLSESFC